MLRAIFRNSLRFFNKNRLSVSTTTGFFRNEEQMETILRLLPTPKKIYFFGCSDGCEPYTFAIHLYAAGALENCEIIGFDINQQCIDHAKAAIYSPRQLDYYGAGKGPVGSNARFFEPVGNGNYRVTPEISRSCQFNFGSILDEQFMTSLQPADIVFCQNVLIHLPPEQNRIALEYLRKLLKKESILVIGGMQPDIRGALIPSMNLVPIPDNCRAIHDGWRDLREYWDRSAACLREYYALEPFRETPDWQFRYGSLFRASS